jgi:hypothetical protein
MVMVHANLEEVVMAQAVYFRLQILVYQFHIPARMDVYWMWTESAKMRAMMRISIDTKMGYVFGVIAKIVHQRLEEIGHVVAEKRVKKTVC